MREIMGNEGVNETEGEGKKRWMKRLKNGVGTSHVKLTTDTTYKAKKANCKLQKCNKIYENQSVQVSLVTRLELALQIYKLCKTG